MQRIIVEAGPKTKVRRGAERKSEIFQREKRIGEEFSQGAHYKLANNSGGIRRNRNKRDLIT